VTPNTYTIVSNPAESAQMDSVDFTKSEDTTKALHNLIASFLHLVGVNADVARLAQHHAWPADGPDSAALVQALQSLSLEVIHHRTSIDKLIRGPLPALTHDIDGGWLLIGHADAHNVVVQASGAAQPQKLTWLEFGQRMTQQAAKAAQIEWITARSQAAGMVPGSHGAGLGFGVGWFWTSLSQYKRVLGEVLLASFFIQIFALLTPLIFQVVIDKVLTHRSMTTLDVMVVALLGVGLFEVVLSAMRHYLFTHTTNRVDVELGAKLFRHLLHLPLSYFESRRSGDTVARVRELENARNFMTGSALTSWLDLFFAMVFLGVMFYYSVALTLIVICSLPVFFAASWLITPLMRKKLEDKFALGAENQTFLVETVTSMETLKSHAVEGAWQRDWERRLCDYVTAAFEAGHLGNATNQFIGLASKVLTVLLLYFGARLVIDGDMTVGGLIAFNMLSGRVNAPILKLASLWQDFTQMKVSIKRLADIMNATPEPVFQPGRSTPPALEGRVTFENVSFRYTPNAPEVLGDVSVDIRPGEIVGITGISGAGKTTFMRLVQRLYLPEKGRVLLDGMDLSVVDTAWLRRQIGVVGQDTALFNRSVRENIALGNPAIAMDAVMESARLAGAHEFILQLPEGYDTVIGERGSKLSGGQRSRIAIARALVGNPQILLFDEATAALDYESERVIHDNMARICEGRTVFIVAHRLSTLRMAHRILVLDRGRLMETGNHRELMNVNGRYASLYQAHQVLEAA
jgi:ATP-binding cassette, subfamily B, bacterial HlyB/CyaB